MNYYNDNSREACVWIGELINARLIPNGMIDERSISDIAPSDLRGFTQCHFFAGIAGWPLALAIAGWPDSEPVWSGSCPCQPLSVAGQHKGEKDERHLWPEFYRLISECRPATIFGEQVASKDGLEWIDGVSLDLEEIGYAIGAGDIPAAGIGAPHIRQRLFWGASGGMEHSESDGRKQRGAESSGRGAECGRGDSGLAQPGSQQPRRSLPGPGEGASQAEERASSKPGGSGGASGMGDADSSRLETFGTIAFPGESRSQCFAYSSAWSNYEIVPCRDGKARRFEPGSFPLANGIPGRVGLLRGYGNAIVPQAAALFISTFIEAIKETL